MSIPTQRLAAGNAIALWVIAVLAAIMFLREASGLLIPIVLAVLVSYALEPVVAWLERRRIPRFAGTSLVMLTLVGLLFWGVYSLRDDAKQAMQALPAIAQKAREMISSVTASSGVADAASAIGGSGRSSSSQQPTGGGTPVSSFLQHGVSSVARIAGDLLVVVFLLFFLLLSGHHVKRRIVEVAGPDPARRRTAAKILEDIDAQVQRFLLVRLFTAAVVGVVTWAVLAWMDVDNAAIWGTLAGVFNSIPYFGPVIVSGGLLLVGVAQDGGLTKGLQMSGAALVITSLEGWLLTPPLLGKAERMSVLAVFLGLLLWTWIWGAWGTILAVPMLVVIKSIADHVDPLKPIGRLLAP
jgi:predicted PurR-regulated permease PerM